MRSQELRSVPINVTDKDLGVIEAVGNFVIGHHDPAYRVVSSRQEGGVTNRRKERDQISAVPPKKDGM